MWRGLLLLGGGVVLDLRGVRANVASCDAVGSSRERVSRISWRENAKQYACCTLDVVTGWRNQQIG